MLHPPVLRIAGLTGGVALAGGLAVMAIVQVATNQPPRPDDLIGLLGLPGALVSLMAAFLLGVKAVQAIKGDRPTRIHDIREVFNGHEAEDQRRHDELMSVLRENSAATERRRDEVMDKLQRIEDLSYGRQRGRKP